MVLACSKQGMVGLIALTDIVVDFQRTPTIFVSRNVIFFQTGIYPLHVFDRGSEFILLVEPFCKTLFRVTYSWLICFKYVAVCQQMLELTACVPAPNFERTQLL